MESESLLARLEEEGVFTEDAGSISVSDSFEERLDELEEMILQGNPLDELLTETIDNPQIRKTLENISQWDLDPVVEYLALRDFVSDLTHLEIVQGLIGLEIVQRGPPESSGTPNAFTSVYGDQLPYLLKLVRRAVVYVWRHDCDPCEVMVETFDGLFEASPQDVSFFSVYGPDSAQILEEEYDVQGGPVTLFVIDGAVDSRVYGATYPIVIEHELDFIRDN